jgi:2,3-diaminopropionate biosynthesis protein SbnA
MHPSSQIAVPPRRRPAEGVLGAVGDTPLIALRRLLERRDVEVFAKLEAANPGGSAKDRPAVAMLEDALLRGLVATGGTVVESTSGNLGVALATIARRRGLRFQAIVDPKITPENLARLLALGTHVECVTQPDDGGGYLLSRLRRVHGLCASSDRFVWPDQYTNPANPWAHEHGTGPELLAQSAGELDAVLVPVSTGGTLAGIARCLRREAPATRLVAVDVRGSVALGGQPAPRLLTGIGASRSSAFLSAAMFDERIFVADAAAFAFCRALVAATGIWIGGSSGATLAASVRLLTGQSELERIVCVCPDRGERYASTIYNDRWLAERGIDPDDLTIDPVQAISCAPRALIAA